MRNDEHDHDAGPVALLDRGVALAEGVLYLGVALLLLAGAVVTLGDAAGTLLDGAGDDGQKAATETLEKLLLVFILVELLGAVRTTVRERKLIAEPFLIVGIIASIKEIVITAVEAKERIGKGDEFDDSMTAIGVMTALLLVLGVTAYLTRRKEREPSE